MQCLVKYLLIFYIFQLIQLVITNSENAVYVGVASNLESSSERSLLVCENQTGLLSCVNGLIDIYNAYYGRYSVGPCNPTRIPYQKYQYNCISNKTNTMNILKKTCQNRKECIVQALNSEFGSPCINATHMLEIKYYCIDLSKLSTMVIPTTSIVTSIPEEQFTTSSSTTKPTTITTTRFTQSKSNKVFQQITTDFHFKKPDCRLVDMENSETYNRYEGEYMARNCSKYDSGVNFYKCESKQFKLINSTCLQITTIFTQKTKESKNKSKIEILNEILEKDEKGGDHTMLNSDSFTNVIQYFKISADELKQNKSQLKENSSKALINTMNTLLNQNDTWQKMNEKDRSSNLTILLDTVENTFFETPLLYNKSLVNNIQINTSHVVAELKSNKELKNEIRFPTNEKLITKDSVFLTLKKPRVDQKFLFIVYSNIENFLTESSKNDEFQGENNKINDDSATKSNQIINTNIISFKMNREDVVNLKETPIELTFSHISTESRHGNPVCSYWKYDNKTYEGEWHSDGCIVKSTNQTHTVCQCNHLTHFAVLMDIYGAHAKARDIHQTLLTIITIICSTLSIVCIIFTLLAFRYIKLIKKNRDNSTKDLTIVTTHLCVCLLASLTVFLFGIFVKGLGIKVLCSITAIISHYLFLCAFFWMFLEGVQLYLMLVRIFILEKSPLSKFCLFAYGCPFIIVFISVLVNYIKLDGHGYGTVNYCWLSTYQKFNLSFIGPVAGILASNLIILVIVIYTMRNKIASQKEYLNRNKKQDNSLVSLLGFWCLILTLLGLPWIIGFFIVDDDKAIIFSYIFTIVNSSQGTVIFIFHCIISKNVRDELIKMLHKHKQRLFSTSDISTSKQSTTNRQQKYNRGSPSTSFAKRKSSNYTGTTNVSNTNSKVLSTDTSANGSSVSSFLQKAFCCTQSSTYKVQNVLHVNNSMPHVTVSSATTVGSSDENSSAKLLIYENALANTGNVNTSKTLQYFNPEQNRFITFPKRHSSMLSSNSGSSNQTQSTYLPRASSTSCSGIPPPPPPYSYYLTPKSINNYNDIQLQQQQQLNQAFNLASSTHFTTFKGQQRVLSNYANHNLVNTVRELEPPEEHNYSLIESEFQSDSQYYCDDQLLDDNNYTEMHNQYDEVDERFFNEDIPTNNLNLTNKYGFTEAKSSTLSTFTKSLVSQNQMSVASKQMKVNDLTSKHKEYEIDISIENTRKNDKESLNITPSPNSSETKSTTSNR